MHKIPVFATVGNAYRFLVREFGTIVRLSWFPLLIATALQYFAARAAYQHFIDALNGQRELSLTTVYALQYGPGLLQFVAAAIVAVALHRVILFSDRKPGQIVYLAFGKVEGIFILLPFLLAILAIPCAFALSFGSAWLTQGLGYQAERQSSLVHIAIPVVLTLLFGLAAFVITRLSLLFPLAVAERRIGLREGWRLGRGNFWRLFGVLMLGVVPFGMVIAIATALLVTPTPFAENAEIDEVLRYFEELRDALATVTVINLVAGVVGGALGVGLLCYAFKAAKGYAPDDVLSDPAAPV
jgi:hypothetical protein